MNIETIETSEGVLGRELECDTIEANPSRSTSMFDPSLAATPLPHVCNICGEWHSLDTPHKLTLCTGCNTYHAINDVCPTWKSEGIKCDDSKLRYDLVPSKPFEELVKVLTFGANKYSPNNWQLVEPARPRYSAALMRHFELWRQGEQFDKETHIHHLAHVACNALFLTWFDLTGK